LVFMYNNINHAKPTLQQPPGTLFPVLVVLYVFILNGKKYGTADNCDHNENDNHGVKYYCVSKRISMLVSEGSNIAITTCVPIL
jgi:hypothetical protein